MTLSGTYSTADQSCPCSGQLFVGLTLSSRQCSPCSQITTQVTVTHFMKNKKSCWKEFEYQEKNILGDRGNETSDVAGGNVVGSWICTLFAGLQNFRKIDLRIYGLPEKILCKSQ